MKTYDEMHKIIQDKDVWTVGPDWDTQISAYDKNKKAVQIGEREIKVVIDEKKVSEEEKKRKEKENEKRKKKPKYDEDPDWTPEKVPRRKRRKTNPKKEEKEGIKCVLKNETVEGHKNFNLGDYVNDEDNIKEPKPISSKNFRLFM